MVFQRPNPFPKSIFENVAFGPKVLGAHPQSHLFEIVEKSLKGAALWEEVVDHLQHPATELSLGQQQQVEIIKALWHGSKILILDEPTSMLTPKGIEDLERVLMQLKQEDLAVVFITHKLHEAFTIGDRVSVLRQGRLEGTIDRETMTAASPAEISFQRAS